MASRREELVNHLKRDIVAGRFPPGGRIPPHKELADRFGVAGMTVQMALKHLEREGFIEARGRAGTFVVQNPPHLSRVALVFPAAPAGHDMQQDWSRYYQALTQAAIRFQRDTGRQVLVYHAIDDNPEREDRRRLIADIEAQCLAGLIFSDMPYQLAKTPILDFPGMPRVVFDEGPVCTDLPLVTGDVMQWIDKALDYFVSQRCRKVGLIDYGGRDEQYLQHIMDGVAARGMVMQRRWHQYVAMRTPAGASRAAELLMHDADRPDALMINDDNFVELALAGLRDAGVRVPEDVAVVGHANYPVPPPKLLPARFLCYDANLIIGACVDCIDRQRRGEAVPGRIMVPALWEDELSGGTAAGWSPKEHT